MIDMFFASIVLFLVCLDMIGAFVIFSCYIIRYICKHSLYGSCLSYQSALPLHRT